uniref:Retrotransposon gag domain-containing protein n=1 Tax=Stomoxys calcitrans TaxID=35570 RepID=A0A1I8QER5_STOCA
MVRNLKTAREIWKYFQETYDRKSTRRKAEVFRKLLNLKMSHSRSLSEYLIEFDICVSSLSEMEVTTDESLLSIILLDGLSDKFKEIRAAFDTANEFPSLNVLRSRLSEVGCEKGDEDAENAMKAKKLTPKQNKYQGSNADGVADNEVWLKMESTTFLVF